MADMDTVLLCAGASSKDASDCAVERSRQDGEVAGNEVGFLQQCEMNAIRVFRHLGWSMTIYLTEDMNDTELLKKRRMLLTG